MNPDWDVVKLDAENLGVYLDTAPHSALGRLLHADSRVPPASVSQVVRLALLSQYGGVWADATVLCMQPLDDWLYDAVLPCSFWMYHGRDRGSGPASWFVAATKHSYIVRRWCDACALYWAARGHAGAPADAEWMDALFADLVRTDGAFAAAWRDVPYLWCDAFGQSRMLEDDVSSECSRERRDLLATSPPHVLKLSHHHETARLGLGDGFEASNLYFAVQASRSRQRVRPDIQPLASPTLFKLWPAGALVPRDQLPPFTARTLVAADCGCRRSADMIVDICRRADVTPLIYDKCSFCAHVPIGVYARPLCNVGRELATFCWFVVQYYEQLPDTLYFTAGNMLKHSRAERLERLLNEGGRKATPLALEASFELPSYEGAELRRATVRPFSKWYERLVGPWQPNQRAGCFNALLQTTREAIQKRPRHFYINLYHEASLAKNTEVGHFMERSAYAIFASSD